MIGRHPKVRLIGSIILSFMTRLATGYWTIGDHRMAITLHLQNWLNSLLNGLYPRYGVPNDLLITCAVYGVTVQDVLWSRYTTWENSPN